MKVGKDISVPPENYALANAVVFSSSLRLGKWTTENSFFHQKRIFREV